MAEPEWTRWYKFSEVFQHHKLVGDDKSSGFHVQIGGKKGSLHTDDGFRLRSMKTGSLSGFHNELEAVECPINRGDIGLYWIHVEHPEVSGKYDYIGMSHEFTHGIVKRLIQHFQKLSALPNRSQVKDALKKLQKARFVTYDQNKGDLREYYGPEMFEVREQFNDVPNQGWYSSNSKQNIKGRWELGEYGDINKYRLELKFNDNNNRDKKWTDLHKKFKKKDIDLYDIFNTDFINLCFYKIDKDSLAKEDIKNLIESAEGWAHLNFHTESGSLLDLNVKDERKNFNGNPSDVMKGFTERLNDIYPTNKTPIQLFKDRVAQLPQHQQGIIEYLESKNYNSTSELLMHVRKDGMDMRFSAPYYQHNDQGNNRLGDGSARRNLMTLAPQTRKGTFLCRSYLSPEDFNNTEIVVRETRDTEPLNSEFDIDESITAKRFEDILIGTFKKWSDPDPRNGLIPFPSP